MGMIQEFKAFALRGNVVDMAVGIIIGAAFGKVTTSFVNDVVMPPIGLLLGNADFTEFAVTLKAATAEAPAVTLNYGAFITTVLDFTIMAFAVFLVIKGMNSLKRKEEEEPPPPPPEMTRDQVLLTEIRDALHRR
jgi:large conductance mechanosensitive channel